VFAGTRVPARTLFEYLESGETLDDFLRQFPSVSRDRALAALEMARDSVLDRARSRITIEPGTRGGKPCIRGLRITVYDVLEYLASGMSEAEILSDFPDLERDDIRAVLTFAADRERRLVTLPPA